MVQRLESESQDQRPATKRIIRRIAVIPFVNQKSIRSINHGSGNYSGSVFLVERDAVSLRRFSESPCIKEHNAE